MKRTDKVIITCAVTGSIHTPSMTPHLPITADQIAAEAIAAAEAGAAMVHLHARNPETGQPSQDPELFRQFLPRIKQSTDVIVNITTGGGLGMSLADRLAPAKTFRPEVCSMNMGSVNFNISGAGAKIADWQFDWELPYLEMTKDFILSNTFAQIEQAMTQLSDQGTRFEFECYDVAHLYNLAHFVDRKMVEPPFFIQGVFGILGGIGPDPENVMHMKTTADRLFGEDFIFSALAAGKHQMRLVTLSALLGGSVRVGLEDSLYAGRGKLATSNAEQVAKIRRVLEELSLTVATPDEARALMQTKGGDDVAF
ncbi:3-keto-5-aminohexanoate cleavage protein [Sphingomonadales bacterium 56]|uniref:3-keto-5-aminohexanoate cleavage protein n=1 Tax=unclassified Sphingobium TaxID=2611147 RepID=UPI00191B8E48|nr:MULTISPECIES: 3-keto-5-aminohexanoate cleavage protein [unclassified Sphingobium]MBY2930493.1 3-keto-5-aminohexanoate cleavage protein [Sphingomonadales bacterium 56]MBY2960493.1 3-keto-5-aminohexanoate cleavage protein [Sphingomonadales bacterium 58]CAD7341313.1 3-keto-5-aminohexanoate cleavage enzyme [Sphingobium sp. S8]CAD7341418.1 3-keto-5-aminohexanoate cleavage enzyme [Sphingobium sp. S6]